MILVEKKMGVGVGVVLLKDGKILLGKRNQDPKKAGSVFNSSGTWTLPGGKMEFGESFEETAKREVMEETGIEVKNLKLISVTNDMSNAAHFVTIGFLSTEFEGSPIAREIEEITEWKWFGMNGLPSPMYDISVKILKNYSEGKVYKY